MLKSTFIVANVVLSFLDVFVALEISRDRIGNSYVRMYPTTNVAPTAIKCSYKRRIGVARIFVAGGEGVHSRT